MATSSRTKVRFQLDHVGHGVLLLRWDEALAVTAQDVLTLIEHQDSLSPGSAAPILVDLNGMMTLSRDAFALLAASLNASAIAALGTSAVEHVLIEHFHAVHKPPYPVEYFESSTKALDWLHHVNSC